MTKALLLSISFFIGNPLAAMRVEKPAVAEKVPTQELDIVANINSSTKRLAMSISGYMKKKSTDPLSFPTMVYCAVCGLVHD
jgi:hypothetical protein